MSSGAVSVGRSTTLRGFAAAPLTLAFALPVLLLHSDFQPELSFGIASTEATVRLADVAVLAVVVAAATRLDGRFLTRARPLWLAAAAFVALIFAATLYGAWRDDAYPFAEHLVNAVKFVEYALLAPAVALIVRSRRDAAPLFAAVVVSSAAATAVGVAQYLGADVFNAWPQARRQPSFLGHHDFAALSGVALCLSLATIAFGASTAVQRRTAWVAGLSGGLGAIVAGAVTGAFGIVLAGVAAALLARRCGCLTRRRLAYGALVVGTVCTGVVAIRGENIEQFLRYVNVLPEERTTTEDVQTFAHRTLLAYIGVRIFADHPVAGVGWQGSADEFVYSEYLDDARRRFPDQPPQAFPSPEHPWGVENAYLQAAADMGVGGLLALVALLAAGVFVGARAVLHGPPGGQAVAVVGLMWLLVAAGVLNGLGLVAGLPLDALLWISLGLVAAGSASE